MIDLRAKDITFGLPFNDTLVFTTKNVTTMKKLSLMVLCALLSVAAFSQPSLSQNAKSFFQQLEYTISIGYGTTSSSEPFDKAIFNLNAGIDAKKVFKSLADDKVRLYGMTGLHFSQHGGKKSNDFMDMTQSGNSFRQTQFNIPIHVGVKYIINEKFHLFADFGPYIGLNTSCSLSDGYNDKGYKLESKPLDIGIGGNFGVCFKKFGLGIGIDKGFLDIAEYSNEDRGHSESIKSNGVFYFKLQWTFNKQ